MSKTSNQSSKSGNRQKQLVPLMLLSAIVVFGISGWAWWHIVRSNPQRTLYAAIDNNFRTRSVTRQVSQISGSQKLDQGVELSLVTKPVAHGNTTITQTGGVNAAIHTEAISTPTEEFVRYTAIGTNQKNSKGQVLNFDNLLNIWGKTSTEQTGEPGALYGESILGVVPTANLNANDRQALMKTIRDNNVYDYDTKTLHRSLQNGRPTYVYDVKVAPSAYIELLKQFGGMMNLSQLEGLDPSQYKDAQPLTFKLTIDVWSQRLTGINYEGDTRTELLGSYGINHDVKLPTQYIPVEDLQAKLQAVQQ